MSFLFPRPHLIAIACFILSFCPSLPAMSGDVNLDNVVNNQDHILISKYALSTKQIPSGGIAAADLNGDGLISINDSVLLAKRLKEKQAVLKNLDRDSGKTGSPLNLTLENISDADEIIIRFVNPQGSVVDIIATIEGDDEVCVQVPVFMDINDWLPLSGTVSISVLRLDEGVVYESETVIEFSIFDLPTLDSEPGTVTIEALEELEDLLDEIENEWEDLEIASLFTVITNDFRNDLDDLGDELDDLIDKIKKLKDGETDEIEIGEIDDQKISLNRDSLTLLDQLLAAHYLNDHDVGGVDCDDLRECMGDEFELEAIVDLIQLLAKYDKYRRTGYSAAGNAEWATRTLKENPNDNAANSVAAFLQFSNLTPTAVLATHSHSHAAPFVIFDLGRSAKYEDYDSFLDGLDSDSKDFFNDWNTAEIEDIFDDLFNDAEASETLRDILDKTEDLLDRVDLEDLENSIWDAFDSAEIIYQEFF